MGDQHIHGGYLLSWRFLISLSGMMGSLCLYTMRVNLSLAIVCMVKDPQRITTLNLTLINRSETATQHIQCEADLRTNIDRWDGEFDWSRKMKGLMLSSFFIGYILTQLPGGLLAQKIGGKRVVGGSVLVLSIATLLTPIGARSNPAFVVALRIICGLSSGVYFPAFFTLVAKWVPPLERTKHVTLIFAGTNIGSIVTFWLSGYLCDYGFDGGWPSIFYIFGSIGMVWTLIWFLIASESPSTHPRISENEKNYIYSTLGKKEVDQKGSTPWIKIVTSPRCLVVFLGQFAYSWTRYTILTSLPQYMKDVLYFDIKSNGLYNALPYLCMFVMSIGVACLGDWMLTKKYITATILRKLIQSGGFLPPSITCIAIGFLNCDHRDIAVALLCICVGFTGFTRAGILCNVAEVAPKYSGVICGISATTSMVAAALTPIVASALTPEGAQYQWRNVFYLCAGLSLAGEIIYVMFASAEPEMWGIDKVTTSENDVLEIGVLEQGDRGVLEQGDKLLERNDSPVNEKKTSLEI